jgi:hypothetical protein
MEEALGEIEQEELGKILWIEMILMGLLKKTVLHQFGFENFFD